MVEEYYDELALIFEAEETEDGKIYERPIDIVEGYYHEEDDRFIDINQYTYSHLTRLEEGRAYAFRMKISDLSLADPDKSLTELKQIVLDTFSQINYIIGFIEDVPAIFMENKETGELTLAEDEESMENLLMVLEDEDLDKLISNLENENTEEISLNTKSENKKIVINPHKLYKEITKTVKAQNEAVRKIATTIWKNYTSEDNAKNMIVLGPSGCGKTEIFRQLTKLLDVPLLIFSCSGVSQTGYKGSGTDEILANLLALTKGDVEKAERAIVILDEFDKLAYSDGASKISTDVVQDELLKIVEDGTFAVEMSEDGFTTRKTVNTSHITFVGVGAFTGTLKTVKEKQMGFGNDIYVKEIEKEFIDAEDLENFGFKPEIIGRMSEGGIIKLNNLSLEDIIDIICNSEKSAYKSNIKFIKNIIPSFNVLNEDELITEIAKRVLAKKTGARGISNVVESLFSELLYEISNPEEEYKELTISKEFVTDPKKYVLKK